MNTTPTPDEHALATALEQLGNADLISLVQQMVQLHPDLAGLIKTQQPTASKRQHVRFDPEQCRRQVNEIFYHTDRTKWGSEGRAAGPLLDIKDIGDEYVQQQDYADATTLYEIIIRGIFDNYASFRWHADEGDLDGVVEDCVDGLDECLSGVKSGTAVRQQIIRTLYDVYDFDMSLENDEPVMGGEVPTLLVRHTTPEERQMVAQWLRKGFQLDIDWYHDDVSEDYDDFLLGLEADTIDDETFMRICRETENYNYLVDRLLKLGRLEDALAEATHVASYDILETADIFCERGYEDKAAQLIEARVKQSNDTDLLEWLQDHYQAKGDIADALDMANRIFRAYPLSATLDGYKEIRELAQELDRWDTVRSELLAFLEQAHNTALQIKIALDEGQVERALLLLKAGLQTKDSHNGPYGDDNFNVGIEVAQAAEASHPHESIDIYQRYVETRIEWRGRDNYRIACQYLTSVRKLYQKIGRTDAWTSYIAELRDQHRNLPALRDELAKAKL